MNHLLANKYPAGFMHQRLQNPIMPACVCQAQLITPVNYRHTSLAALITSLRHRLFSVLNNALSTVVDE